MEIGEVLDETVADLLAKFLRSFEVVGTGTLLYTRVSTRNSVLHTHDPPLKLAIIRVLFLL